MGITAGAAVALGGLVGGVLSSAPIGPINLHVIHSTVRGRPVFAFLAGVVLADATLAAIAALGYGFIFSGRNSAAFSAVAGVILVVLGVRAKRPAKTAEEADSLDRRASAVVDFGMGALFCAANPGFLAFWVLWCGVVSPLWGDLSNGIVIAGFATGVVAGDAIWFTALDRIARLAKSTTVLQLISRATAWILIATGGFMVIRAGVNYVAG